MARDFGLTTEAPWASAPAVGAAGNTYFNTTDKSCYVSDGTAWLKVGPGTTSQAQVKRTTNQSIPNSTETATIFDTIVSNVGSMYSAGTPDRFTIQTAGFYLVGGYAIYTAAAGGTERNLHIGVNAITAYNATVNDAPRSGSTINLCVTAGLLLAATNTVFLVSWHDAGAALNVGQQGFWIVRVG